MGTSGDTITIRKPAKGSSPRVWGQGNALEVFNVPVRIIPTRMGTSLAEWKNGELVKDHPHACGDKSAYRKTAA